MKDKKHLLNKEIKHDTISLIESNGNKIDSIELSAALNLSFDQGMDLVQMGIQDNIPVCKMMDYGKFLYQNKKKQKNSSKAKPIKEIYFRPSIDNADKIKKFNDIISFLSKGHEVRAGVKFRGREMAHKNLGIEIIKNLEDFVIKSNSGKIKSEMSFSGKFVSIGFSSI